jgi:hypothetical protein
MSQSEPINHSPGDPWWALVFLIGATAATFVWVGAIAWIIFQAILWMAF